MISTAATVLWQFGTKVHIQLRKSPAIEDNCRVDTSERQTPTCGIEASSQLLYFLALLSNLHLSPFHILKMRQVSNMKNILRVVRSIDPKLKVTPPSPVHRSQRAAFSRMRQHTMIHSTRGFHYNYQNEDDDLLGGERDRLGECTRTTAMQLNVFVPSVCDLTSTHHLRVVLSAS